MQLVLKAIIGALLALSTTSAAQAELREARESGVSVASLLEADAARAAKLASLKLGLDLLESGRAELAHPHLEVSLGGPLDDLAHFSLGRAMAGTGEPEGALEHLEVVARDLASPWRHEAARLRARCLAEAGKPRGAVRAYEALLERYDELPNRPVVMLELADVWESMGRGRPEAEVLARLVWRFPDTPEAETARQRLDELAKRRVKVDPPTFAEYLDRARLWTRDRRFDLAFADLDRAAAMAGRSADRQRAVRYGVLKAWMRDQRWDDVIGELLPELGKRPEQDSDLAQMLSVALRKSGRTDEGLALLKRLSRKTRGVSKRDYAKALLEEGRIAEADKVSKKLHRRTKEGGARTWEGAWLDYRVGRYDKAILGFEEVARRSRRQRQRARYWIGRAHQEAGRAEQAVAAFQACAELDPRDYYAYQARSRLFDLGSPDEAYAEAAPRIRPIVAAGGGRIAPARVDVASVPDRESTPLEELRRVATLHGDTMPRLHRALALLELGREDDARREMRIVMAELDYVRRNPRAVSRLIGKPLGWFLDRRRTRRGVWGEDLSQKPKRPRRAVWKAERARLVSLLRLSRDALEDVRTAFRAVEDPWGVRRMTHRLEWYSKGVPNGENRRYYMDTHPLAWRENVQREAENNRIDPVAVWSVMTVESAYNETAHSVSNARGLLQLLPRTAWLVARDTDDPAPHPTELLAPERNLRYGVWYLKQLDNRFDGQSMLAFASYNAGPHNVAWRAARHAKQPFDVVIEEIPSNVGREYAKKVVRYIGHYRRVYLDDTVVYVGQKTIPPGDGIAY